MPNRSDAARNPHRVGWMKSALACSAMLALGAAASLGVQPASAQTTVPCYPPTEACVTTTTSAASTTSTNPNRGPDRRDRLSVSDSTLVAGQRFTVSVSVGTYQPGTSGIIVLDCNSPNARQIGTFRVAADGSVTQEVTMPTDVAQGRHEICTIGTDTDGRPLTLTRAVTVLGSGGRSEAPRAIGLLPRTGAAMILPAAGAGILLVVAGLLMRRRAQR